MLVQVEFWPALEDHIQGAGFGYRAVVSPSRAAGVEHHPAARRLATLHNPMQLNVFGRDWIAGMMQQTLGRALLRELAERKKQNNKYGMAEIS